ncbi:MAG: DUF2171 domain-containing protein [Gaiellaceae bacterium]
MADPVSWILIEPGWNVVSSDGADVGHIDAVTGDENADIFNGLAIASGPLGKPRYVPAEKVARIVEGCVELALTKDEVDALGEFDEPPASETIDGDRTSLVQRAEQSVRGGNVHAHSLPALQRVRLWVVSLFRGRR